MSDVNEHEARIIDGTMVVSQIEPEEVITSQAYQLLDPRFQRAIAQWAEDPQSNERQSRGLFQRNKYVTPGDVLGQMALAYDTADDDIVSGILDTSESIAFQKVRFESKDEDQEDVWNQIGADLDIDGFVRSAFRELSLVSQIYGIRWWGRKTYQVRGEGEGGRSRRKKFDLTVPIGLGFMDPLRVIPVAGDLFGGTQLAWHATDEEMARFQNEPDLEDSMIGSLFLGKYEPSKSEEMKLKKEDIKPDRLMLLNPAFVFRHTLTKAPFDRWAQIRMKSLFPILDLKHQVREMDRAWLLSGINFLVLVTRGTDTVPAKKTEVLETVTMMRTMSKSPVIVTDHRIKIEIITPDIEHVLDSEKWSVLDERIMMRMWGTFTLASDSGGRETSSTMGKLVARGLASRRHMLKRTIEKELVKAVQEHPDNAGEQFDEKVKLEYSPRHIELEFDPTLSTIMQELRDRGDISRQTVLAEHGFDQDLEAQRREREDEKYKDEFEPTNVPFDSPNKTTPGGSGRTARKKADPASSD